MRARLRKWVRHYRQGTALDAVRAKFGRLPPQVKVHFLGADSESEATEALGKYARVMAANSVSRDGWIALLGEDNAVRRGVERYLRGAKVACECISLDALLALPPERTARLLAVVCTDTQARAIAAAAERLTAHPLLSKVPFEYAPGLDRQRQVFEQRDEYAQTYFVSPLLRDPVDVYALYEESLQRFEQKCGLRDFLDLYQVLLHVHKQAVPGDIVEFGSYRGHSGWLIARVLDALGSDKKLYLFDMFEKFPAESYGVDGFWSHTHDVDFDEVRAKFAGMPRVALIKGDLTQTLATSGVERVALAYVDCDSYRATRFLIDEVYHRRLSLNGAMVFEDYGHPALLGNRLAVDEGLRCPAPAGFQFFSQFSGLYVAVKTAG